MAASALEKNYQVRREGAIAEALERYPTGKPIVSFGDHDCIVDVLIPGESPVRFVYLVENE